MKRWGQLVAADNACRRGICTVIVTGLGARLIASGERGSCIAKWGLVPEVEKIRSLEAVPAHQV